MAVMACSSPRCLAAHAATTSLTATDHGYAVAMAWGAGILLVTAAAVVVLVNAPRLSR